MNTLITIQSDLTRKELAALLSILRKMAATLELNERGTTLRTTLVTVALEWQEKFGVAPHITSAISEYDVALLVGLPEDDYCSQMPFRTAVKRGYDFVHNEQRYQVKANRPSGKTGSKVTLVSNPKNDEWDILVWVLYDKNFVMQEAWSWEITNFRREFWPMQCLSPDHMRRGERIYP